MLGKAQLINNYSEKFGVSKKAAEEAIDNVISVIREGIVEDGGVKIVGLFSIEKAVRKARDYKNPATGEAVHKDAHNTLKIKVGSTLDKELNN